MLFSAKAEYACLAMLELAARHGDPRPVRLADVADRHGISQRFLVQILLQLKGAGLVASTRGAAGGYLLTRPPAEISLADILGLIDQPARAPGTNGGENPLAASLHAVWESIHESRNRILRETTLATLVDAGYGQSYVI